MWMFTDVATLCESVLSGHRHKLPTVEPPRPLLEDLQFGPLANFQRSLAGANFAATGLRGTQNYGTNFSSGIFWLQLWCIYSSFSILLFLMILIVKLSQGVLYCRFTQTYREFSKHGCLLPTNCEVSICRHSDVGNMYSEFVCKCSANQVSPILSVVGLTEIWH